MHHRVFTTARCILTAAALGIVALDGAPAARAQGPAASAPRLLPTRDVDVSYQIIQGGHTMPQRMRWLAATKQLRIDPPMQGLFVIVDYDARHMSMVRDPEHVVVEMRAPPSFMAGIQDRLTAAVREGDDRISGLACTNWQTRDMSNSPATACVTPDGVLLQVKSNGKIVLTADAVRFGPQDPALFHVPEGYAHLSTDSLPRAGGGAP